jgi:chromosome segregation ATPase
MRAVTPGRISFVTRKELAAVVAECAARGERAEASIRESRAGIEVARRKQEAAIARQETAIARQEAATARLNEIQGDLAERNKRLDEIQGDLAERNKRLDDTLVEMRAARVKAEAEREDEKIWREESLRRQEKMFQDFLHRADAAIVEGRKRTEEIVAEIRDQREDLRAMKDAILKLIDRLPPPPPHLRSA